MIKTITTLFTSRDQVRNVCDDLISSGIDAEKVFADHEHFMVKVMIPDDIEREVTEILSRHKPNMMH